MTNKILFGATALIAALVLSACGGGSQSDESLNAPSHQQSEKIQAPLLTQNNNGRVSVGSNHVVAVDSTGIAYAWGDNTEGQLGSASPASSDVPLTVAGMSHIQSVKAGYTHSVALATNGLVFAWGQNDQGEVGTGSYSSRALPIQVVGMSSVQAIAAGQAHTEALRNDGTVWAWGNMGSGAQAQPQMVAGLSSVTAISAGGQFAVALRSDGTVWGWGNNAHGQLGRSSPALISSPVLVVGLSNVVAIAAGENHVVALKDDGTVWTWGLNSSGQLGEAITVASTTVPHQVANLKNISSIGAGYNNSATVDTSGLVRVWGNGSYGQIGNGKITAVNAAPAPASLITKTAYFIGFGASNAIVLQQDGTLTSVGENNLGQLGDDRYTNSFTPVLVSGLKGIGQLRLGIVTAIR